MPSPEEMAQGVNVDELEAHCFAAGPKYSRKAQVKDATKDAASPGMGLSLVLGTCPYLCFTVAFKYFYALVLALVA